MFQRSDFQHLSGKWLTTGLTSDIRTCHQFTSGWSFSHRWRYANKTSLQLEKKIQSFHFLIDNISFISPPKRLNHRSKVIVDTIETLQLYIYILDNVTIPYPNQEPSIQSILFGITTYVWQEPASTTRFCIIFFASFGHSLDETWIIFIFTKLGRHRSKPYDVNEFQELLCRDAWTGWLEKVILKTAYKY